MKSWGHICDVDSLILHRGNRSYLTFQAAATRKAGQWIQETTEALVLGAGLPLQAITVDCPIGGPSLVVNIWGCPFAGLNMEISL